MIFLTYIPIPYIVPIICKPANQFQHNISLQQVRIRDRHFTVNANDNIYNYSITYYYTFCVGT